MLIVFYWVVMLNNYNVIRVFLKVGVSMDVLNVEVNLWKNYDCR